MKIAIYGTGNYAKFPLLLEYNPDAYQSEKQIEDYYKAVSLVYSSFIDVDEFAKNKDKDVSRPISELPEWTRNMDTVQTDLFYY